MKNRNIRNKNMTFQVVVFGAFLTLASAAVASDHECNRPCRINDRRTCVYNFTVENYFVLSKACYNCPFNYTDCFRPHCITTNGMPRHLLTVNRQLPGTSIEVCQDDTVEVWVQNMIDDGMATSIHWHGMHQTNTNFMDGVPKLTQCNILPSETFRYRFKAENPGTHWWHSHTGPQFGDGIHGAFIVRQPDSVEPQRSLYDFDNSDHTMVLIDWPERPQIFSYMEEMQHRWVTPKLIKVLVNGRGRKFEVSQKFIRDGDADVKEFTPYEVFTVSENMRYRFRVISAATRCHLRVMVDNHELTVIASDGHPMVPQTVQSFMIHSGERYDFVLTANQAPGDYWVKIESYGDCENDNNDGHGAAILHYSGYSGRQDYMPDILTVGDFPTDGLILNPTAEHLGFNNTISQGNMRYDPPGGINEDYTDEQVGLRYYIVLRYQQNDNSYYGHPVYYDSRARWGLITPTINNLTMYRSAVPLATQWEDAEKKFCNSSTLNTTTDCTDDLCLCTHMLDIPKGEVVELVMVASTGDPHPMHLHGYTFRVVGEGRLRGISRDSLQDLDIEAIKRMDANGDMQRNLRNPWYKDTITVQAKGGYAIIRFKADNPGIWFFHCHNEGHLMQGMAMIMKVGDPEDFPKPPNYHPKCGGYSYYKNQNGGDRDRCDGITSGCARSSIATIISVMVMTLCSLTHFMFH